MGYPAADSAGMSRVQGRSSSHAVRGAQQPARTSGSRTRGCGRRTASTRSGTYSVLDYGAVGNGSTDDTGALRRALSAATSGATIVIPQE